MLLGQADSPQDSRDCHGNWESRAGAFVRALPRPETPPKLGCSTQPRGYIGGSEEPGPHNPNSATAVGSMPSLSHPVQGARPLQSNQHFRGPQLPQSTPPPQGTQVLAGQHRLARLTQPLQLPTQLRDDWRKWVELSVRIRGLTASVSTLDLWRGFNGYGSLDMVEIFENKRGHRDGSARIRYRPPPTNPFWEKMPFVLKGPAGEKIFLELNLEGKKRSFFAPSPVHRPVRYPELTALCPISMDFGFMFGVSTMMGMYRITRRQEADISFELNLLKKLIDIRFQLDMVPPASRSAKKRVGDKNKMELYRFRIPIAQLQQVHKVQVDEKTRGLLISLDTPPNFYRKLHRAEVSHEEGSTHWTDWDCWFRQTDVVNAKGQQGLARQAVSLRKLTPIIDIGRWTTYRFVFDVENDLEAYDTVLSALRDFNVDVLPFEGFSMTIRRQPAVWEWIDKRPAVENLPGSFLADLEEAVVPPLSFPVRYQLEVCISQGYLNEYNLTSEFVDGLVAMDEGRARHMLECVADSKTRVFDPMTLFDIEAIQGPPPSIKVPHYCIYTRKVTVTPSTVHYNTPTVETSNRVIRRYAEHADRFLRVQFSDEKFQGRINPTEKQTNNEVFTRVKRAMTNGIFIGDRHFEFLAFGNSQFREHGAYFFAPTQHLRAADIRRWMGEFSDIKVIAKHAARLGQCFSTTRAINGVGVEIKEIPDITRNGFTFTDGVGKISEFLAQLIASELDLGMPSNPPSVFQFRLGGCKGILAISPDARHREIHIRPSQYKFPAAHNGLEIIRWSQFASATLNRQLILVLSALGVPDHIFVTRLREMMSNLERAMWDPATALNMLRKNIDPNQMTLAIAILILDGFMEAKEPFTLSLLQLWRAWSIKYLKERAKIPVDKGAFVLGCVDETATLKGHFRKTSDRCGGVNNPIEQRPETLPEIFIQVTDREHKGKYVVIEGICLLARNPSLHPGDIRVVRAVNVPALRHMRDVVVLPQTGDRDIASMCSGGDLDGDDYLVVWDKDLMPREWNHVPMDYTPPLTRKLNRDVNVNDITSFFVTYMKNDRLPTIAHAHLGWADRLDAGVKDEKCLQLAALHSQAVDYVKTGEPARMPRELRVRVWPHFMEKTWVPQEQTYISGKILGQLYDQVERVDFVPQYKYKFDDRVLKAYELSDDILKNAQVVKQQYDHAMRRIMAQHDIATEFEVFSTFVIHHASMSKDYKFHEEMGQISQSLKERFRKECVAQAGSKDFNILGPFVAAMYTVTSEEIALALEECYQKKVVDGKEVLLRRMEAKSMPLMSFPWIFMDIIGKIANGKPSGLTGDSTERQDTSPGVVRWSKVIGGEKVNAEDDVVATTEGLTHLGDLLQLFHHSNESSEVSQIPTPDEIESMADWFGRDSKVRDAVLSGEPRIARGSIVERDLMGDSEADRSTDEYFSIDQEEASSEDMPPNGESHPGTTEPDCKPPQHGFKTREQESVPALSHNTKSPQTSEEGTDTDAAVEGGQSAPGSPGSLWCDFTGPLVDTSAGADTSTLVVSFTNNFETGKGSAIEKLAELMGCSF